MAYPPQPGQQGYNPYATGAPNPYATGQPPRGGPMPGQPGIPMVGAPNPYATGAQQPGWYEVYHSMITPQEQQYYQQWFFSVDTDRSGSITGQELAQVQFNGQPIGPQVGFKLVKVFDRDGSGSIDFREYSILHKFMTLMQNAFLANDVQRRGVLLPQQTFQAIQSSGFQVSLPTIQAMAKKFDPTNQGIIFSTYLFMCAHLAHARSIFEWNDRARTGQIHLSYDALAHITTDVL